MKKLNKLLITLIFLFSLGSISSADDFWNLNDIIHPKLKSYLMAKSERVINCETLPALRKALTLTELPTNDNVNVYNLFISNDENKATTPLRLRIYKPKTVREKYPALLWIHGGGHIMGTPEGNEELSLKIADELCCIVVAPDYRLTPEHPYPADLDDCYNALLWLSKNLPVNKIAVAGQSAGGGLAAAVALRARDEKGPKINFQMLLYPMIDYRNVTPSSHQINDHRAWSRDFNIFSWKMYLANVSGDIPSYASPSMAKDLSGLPPAYIMVCGLDPLRDEDIEYAQRLMQSGVPVELHVIPSATHGFEAIFTESELSIKIVEEYVNALAEQLK